MKTVWMIGAATMIYLSTTSTEAAENRAKIMQRNDIGVAVVNVVDYGRFEEKSSPAAQSPDRVYPTQGSLTNPAKVAENEVN